MTSTGDVDPLPLKKRINLIPRCKVHLFAFDDKPYYSEAVKSLEHWRRFCLRQRGSFFHVESCGKQHLRQIFNDLWDKHCKLFVYEKSVLKVGIFLQSFIFNSRSNGGTIDYVWQHHHAGVLLPAYFSFGCSKG